MTFKQIYSIDKSNLTKKHMIRDAWTTAYHDGSTFYALEKIKKALAG